YERVADLARQTLRHRYAPPASGGRLVDVGDGVTGALDGVQQRLVERLVDDLAQVVQMAAQGVRIGQPVAPDLALDLLPIDHPRRLAHQDGQQLHADRRKLQLGAAAGGAHAGRVEHQVGDLEHFRADLAALAPDQGAQPGFELLDREGFGQVVV